MSKPIKLTETLMKNIVEEFAGLVQKAKMSDGKISYTKVFQWEGDEKATVVFSREAYDKMIALVQQFECEVAWHGTAYRDENDDSKFYITDVLVYPQIISGSTVNTDQDKYQNWLYSLDDETFNNLRMQGHSHVNFGTTPSPVDTTHQEKLLAQLEDDMFYIFIIWNKKFDRTIKIFDLKNNTLYDTADINLVVEKGAFDDFIKEAKEMAVPRTYGTLPNNNYGKNLPAASAPPAPYNPTVKNGGNHGKTKQKNYGTPVGKGADAYFQDEDEELYGYYGGRHYGYQ